MKKLLFAALVFCAIPFQAQATICFGLEETRPGAGTPGNDTITGTSGDDVIFAGGGNDFIEGRGGNDRMCAGPGKDQIKGQGGTDFYNGGDGDDTCLDTTNTAQQVVSCEHTNITGAQSAAAVEKAMAASASVMQRLRNGISVPSNDLKRAQKAINKARIKLGN